MTLPQPIRDQSRDMSRTDIFISPETLQSFIWIHAAYVLGLFHCREMKALGHEFFSASHLMAACIFLYSYQR
jgi:hypothetical protein